MVITGWWLMMMNDGEYKEVEYHPYNTYIIYIYIWVNYNDLTATSLESWLIRGIIPKWA
jgi:hypothetical protein